MKEGVKNVGYAGHLLEFLSDVPMIISNFQ